MNKKNPSEKSQRERFEETARQLRADDSDDALDRAIDKLDLRVKPKDEGEKLTPLRIPKSCGA